jgi:hypothetical protein
MHEEDFGDGKEKPKLEKLGIYTRVDIMQYS